MSLSFRTQDADLQDHRVSAEITVFLALCITVICSLCLNLAESVRVSAGRLYFETAANAAADSLFSQYHRELWEKYRLLGLEYYREDQLKEEMSSFLQPYLEAKSWFPMTQEDTEILELSHLVDEDGKIFEREAAAYMRYGVLKVLPDIGEMLSLGRELRDAGVLTEAAEDYASLGALAMDLEKNLQKTASVLDRQQREIESCREDLTDADLSGFIRNARKAGASLSKVPPLIRAYRKNADRLQKDLAEAGNRLEEKLQKGELSDQSFASLKAELLQYDSYAATDGERRRKMESLEERAGQNREFLDACIEEAEEIRDALLEMEEAGRDSAEDDGDPWDDDGYEEEDADVDPLDLIEPLQDHFQQYDLLTMDESQKQGDEKIQQQITDLKSFFERDLLELLLETDAMPSGILDGLEDAPSRLWQGNKEIAESAGNGPGSQGIGYDGQAVPEALMTRVLTVLYMEKMCPSFIKAHGKHPELEYILWGKQTDRENLAKTAELLIACRSGTNLLFLLSNQARRAEAGHLAELATGAFGAAPLAAVVTFLILSLWAFGQALCDTRDLLNGSRVSWIPTDQSFYINLPELLCIPIDGLPNRTGGQKEFSGSEDYADFMRLFLLMQFTPACDYRCMDMIQMNLRSAQPDFGMQRLAASIRMRPGVRTRHLFSGGGIAGTAREYEMHVTAACSYLD